MHGLSSQFASNNLWSRLVNDTRICPFVPASVSIPRLASHAFGQRRNFGWLRWLPDLYRGHPPVQVAALRGHSTPTKSKRHFEGSFSQRSTRMLDGQTSSLCCFTPLLPSTTSPTLTLFGHTARCQVTHQAAAASGNSGNPGETHDPRSRPSATDGTYIQLHPSPWLAQRCLLPCYCWHCSSVSFVHRIRCRSMRPSLGRVSHTCKNHHQSSRALHADACWTSVLDWQMS